MKKTEEIVTLIFVSDYLFTFTSNDIINNDIIIFLRILEYFFELHVLPRGIDLENHFVANIDA